MLPPAQLRCDSTPVVLALALTRARIWNEPVVWGPATSPARCEIESDGAWVGFGEDVNLRILFTLQTPTYGSGLLLHSRHHRVLASRSAAPVGVFLLKGGYLPGRCAPRILTFVQSIFRQFTSISEEFVFACLFLLTLVDGRFQDYSRSFDIANECNGYESPTLGSWRGPRAKTL